MSVTTVDQHSTQPSANGDQGFLRLKPYVHPPDTKAELAWAELVTLDLEEFDKPGGKERLAKQLEHAVHHVGFFYVKNFGLSQEKIDQQFTLAKNFFELPVEEKEKYEANYAEGENNGWRRSRPDNHRPRSIDNVEIFNFPKFTKDFEGKYAYPDLLKPYLPEVEVFARALHGNVVLPLLRLFAIILQLPDEDYLVKQHTYEKKSEDHFRYMIYHPRTVEQWAAVDNGQGGGHTDLGTVTLLFRQPVAGLQILGDDGNWTWVSAQPGTITVNIADTLSHLSGGWLKSSVHRVVAPPEDQLTFNRTGLLYFARPHNDTILEPIPDSPVLQAAGVKSRFNRKVTMEEWVKAKSLVQLNPKDAEKRYTENGKIEVLAGFQDQKYKK
ncbi:hypothetical protein PV08_11717 [Exophiala spinifera]|uniref:Fe2OG dioxygenase domain-containing protein n=1 Tax=Exophiala spinifera TaxID=91928 RepID=A0A0D1Y4T7_9EURO|nr:uncharacterized protein PV08_11717 [Exophiala spinifera]KIW09941.1 hypothetical protein PV08_11717 [Exophiala spinifera]